MRTITADQLKQMVDHGTNFVFVDVRSPEEIHREGTLPHFINIPVGELKDRLSEIPRGRKIVVACSTGSRAALAAAYLRRHGYRDVVSLGMKKYREKGYPLIYPKASR